MSKVRIALLISYDGREFAGWQRQSNDRTVQQELERALQKLTGKHSGVTGSGRTDSGVHATGQVAHFDVEQCSIPAEKFSLALNSHLSRDIRVHKSREVDQQFHSRYSALRREYGYYIYNRPVMPAYMRYYCHVVRQPLNLKLLNQLAGPLTGIHDFSTFTAAGDQSKSRVREIYQAGFIQEDERIVFRIAGNAFLWKMVRSITGTILDMAKNQASPEALIKKLESRDREQAGPTAPPEGLFLERVDYGPGYRFY